MSRTEVVIYFATVGLIVSVTIGWLLYENIRQELKRQREESA